jgi:large subunit ribosomal protein L10
VFGADMRAIADMPSQDQIRATLLALINTPATMLVRLIGTPATQIARVVDEFGRKQGGGEEPAA